MIELIDGMPAGTIGFRAAGEVGGDDYREVLEPALREAAESGEIRMVYALDDGFSMDAGAMLEDAKTGLGLGLTHRSAWKRTAVVTDVEWVLKAIGAFAWMMPGEIETFSAAELERAKAWVAA